jgi:hypothetical protein
MPSLQKENLIKKNCKVILIVICVVIMRLLITCFLVVLLLKLHGESLQYASSSRTGFHPTPISGHGWGKPYREKGGGSRICMFGLSAICRATWKTRNKICFGKIHIRSVCEIIFYAIALMRYWAGIHPET